MSKPVVVSIDPRESRVYLSKKDIPAEPGNECGKGPRWDQCTRPKGHKGMHDDVEWETRAVVTLSHYGVKLDLSNEQQSNSLGFTSYKKWREFIDLVDAEVMDMFRKKEEIK